MSIERKIKKAAEKLRLNKEFDSEEFDKKFPEFINMAKYIKKRLKKEQKLEIRVDRYDYTKDFIGLDLHIKVGVIRVATITCLGNIKYMENYFQDYRPLPESQRA